MLCAALMSLGLIIYLSLTFYPSFGCCLIFFYDWRECVTSVLGTTEHS